MSFGGVRMWVSTWLGLDFNLRKKWQLLIHASILCLAFLCPSFNREVLSFQQSSLSKLVCWKIFREDFENSANHKFSAKSERAWIFRSGRGFFEAGVDFSERAWIFRRMPGVTLSNFSTLLPRACFENSANLTLSKKKFSKVFKKFYEFLKNFSTDLNFVEKSLSNFFQQSGLCWKLKTSLLIK